MWELNYKESWAPNNWCFWTVVLEKTLESPLDCKEILPVHSKGDQSWIFIGRTDVEAETPVLWPPDAKSWLIWKDSDARKDWRQEEKAVTEDEMVEWHHRLNGHGFGWTQGVGDGQGGLVCCGSWVVESDTTEWLNWTDGPDISGSYAILPFTTMDFHHLSHPPLGIILLWLCLFILSGVISPLISSSILGTYWPGEFIFQCPIFLPFHTVHGVLKARILKLFAIPFSSQ